MTNNITLLQALLMNAKFESTNRAGASEIVKMLCSETLSDKISFVAEPTTSIASQITKYTVFRETYNEENNTYSPQTKVAEVRDFGDKFTVIYPSDYKVDVSITKEELIINEI